MIWLIVWPITVAAFVVNHNVLKRVGIAIGVAASLLSIAAGAEVWPLQLIAIAFYWIIAFLIAKVIRRAIRKD